MSAETTASEGATKASEATTTKETIKIPDFLDATLDFSATKLIYDNLTLDNAKGTLRIQEETATINNVTTSLFGGNIALSGNVSTKGTTPTFAMNLDLNKIDIAQSFGQLKMLEFFAPIARALEGDLNTNIKLNGNLNSNLTPVLTSLVGDAFAQIITAEVNPQQAPLLSKLGEKISFLNLDRLSLRDLSTALTFNNGKIQVKPFDFDIKGIKVTAAGSHGLDKTIDYDLTLDVPARYLGGDVAKLLAKLDPKDAETTTVAVPVGLNGTFTSPQISLNTEAAVKTLTQKLIEKQKQDLKDKGTDILRDIVGGGATPKDSSATGGTTTPKTTTQETTQVVKDILGGIFGGGKKKKDSINGSN